ncbi:cell division protein FtsK [Amycolatopsis thermoflava]|uniref:cell division protein FtsK n=1 Tax=Amycolatopsis thermoflava TaxID=84480 RepID=UPI003668EEEF
MTQQHDEDRELARVHYLPTHRADTTPAPSDTEVVEGELISEEEYQRLFTQRGQAIERYKGYRRDLATAGRVVKTVATHEVTKSTGQALLRHGSYVLGGAGIVAKRVWEAKTNSRYERMQRLAEARGDWDQLADWEARAEQARERRHRRRMDWLEAPVKLVKAVVIGAFSLMGALLALGIVLAIANKDLGDVLGPITALFTLVKWIAYAVTVAWLPFLLALPWAAGIALWAVGRHADATPSWLRAAKTAEVNPQITADGIVTALRHLSIPKLNEAFKKEGWQPRFDLTPTREGQGAFRGYRAIFDLPMGVTPEMVADKRDVLAKNLNRNAVEVWASDYGKEKGGKAGYVNLYVADSGVMDKPTPDYPLLHEGTADVFAGVPIGITQRGDVVPMPVVGSNAVFGGQPGQGKSNAVRVAVAGIALDPLAEIRMHVFANNGDFDAYAPRLSLYQKGATPEHVEAAVAHLRDLYDEVGRREGRLAELGAKKLTRALAEQHPDLRPLFVGFSECHELFGHSELGKEAAELAINVVKRGRKTGVSTAYDTQSSRADAIPSQLVENVGFNGCFAVKTWRSNDGFLGDGSFAAGIRATDLRFNVDRGTMVATGASEELFEIVRTFFIKVDDDNGWDQATEIIERAMAQLAPGTPVAGDRPMPQIENDRDLLADLDTVLDDERLPAGDVLGALRSLAPGWKPYRDYTVPRFVAAVKKLGVKVAATGNKHYVDPVTVREILARRATADLDE